MRRVLAPLLHVLPVRELVAGHDVARIGKGRHPAPVFESGVPANMIPVQVRAHHVVDIFDLDACVCEIGEEGGPQPVKLRPCGTLLVIAKAGIDQDRVTPGLDDEAVKAEDELAGRRVDQPWSRHIGVRPHHLGVEIGKENLGSDERPLELGDALHLEIADTRDLHSCAHTGKSGSFLSGGRSTSKELTSSARAL